MKCAVVLIVNDFEALDEGYALEQAFRTLGACSLSEPYYVLISEGFAKIPADFIARRRAERIEVLDVADTVRSLVRDFPYLAALPDNPVYRVTLLRHLILERFFGGEAALSVDADVLWRTDPYRLFGHWDGGYFALGGSGFLTYAAAPEWFDAYRMGLESTLTGGALTADFEQAKFGIKGVQHDQHLINHLEAKGLVRNEWDACHASPEFQDLCLMSTPLHPKQGFREPPARLTFRREGGQDYFNEALVPFWHMQTSFCMACSFHYLLERMLAEQGGRPPFPRPKKGQDNLKAMLARQLRKLIIDGRIAEPRLKALRPLMFRRGIYEAFFDGDLPQALFTDQNWWQAGVFD